MSVFIILTRGYMHGVFGRFISVSGVWVLLWKELIIMAEDSPHIRLFIPVSVP